MAYVRFYRRIPIIPGLVHLNVAKRSLSLSVGKRGSTVTFGRYGIRFTAGLPGSGLFVTEHVPYGKLKESKQNSEARIASSCDFKGLNNGSQKKEG